MPLNFRQIGGPAPTTEQYPQMPVAPRWRSRGVDQICNLWLSGVPSYGGWLLCRLTFSRSGSRVAVQTPARHHTHSHTL